MKKNNGRNRVELVDDRTYTDRSNGNKTNERGSQNVKVNYLKKHSVNGFGTKLHTLNEIIVGTKGDLLLRPLHKWNKKIIILSGKVEYTNESKILQINDEIYVAKRKGNYISFFHYRVVFLQKEEHCELISSIQIYSQRDINKLKGNYKSFIKDFMASR